MNLPNFEKITSTIFPELDSDLVPYVASIIEENRSGSADDIEEALFPILSGYDVVPEEEISKRCKQIPGLLKSKHQKKKYGFVNYLIVQK